MDGTVVSSYGYDDNGNRTSAELSWSQLGYDAKFDYSLTEADTVYNDADQLLAYGTKSYQWNAFGQLESMTDSDPNGDGDTSDSETTSYDYDLYGNLLRVDLPDGRAIEYEVDGAGRRVGRRELAADGTEISFRGWIYRDLLRPIAEVDRDGNVVARYVYPEPGSAKQNGVNQVGVRVGASKGVGKGQGRTVPEVIEVIAPDGSVERRLSVVTDQIGSVRLVINELTGAVEQKLEYDQFGSVLSDTTAGLQPFGFAGGLHDAATVLVRFGARDYDAQSGRWTSRDPIRHRGGENLYLYAGNDPIETSDPSGLAPTPYKDAICLALGIACAVSCVPCALAPNVAACTSCGVCLEGYRNINDDCRRNPCGSNSRGRGSCNPAPPPPPPPPPPPGGSCDGDDVDAPFTLDDLPEEGDDDYVYDLDDLPEE